MSRRTVWYKKNDGKWYRTYLPESLEDGTIVKISASGHENPSVYITGIKKYISYNGSCEFELNEDSREFVESFGVKND